MSRINFNLPLNYHFYSDIRKCIWCYFTCTIIGTESDNKLTYAPTAVMEQFVGQAGSFVSFLHENYLPHFGNIEDACAGAAALSAADCLLAEWRVITF